MFRAFLRQLPRWCAVSLAAALVSHPAWAAWPDDKPIEVTVGFAAGGGTDLLARKLLPFVQKRLGGKAQFIVVNKPGASGEISTTYAAKAKPDGYTLAVVNVPGFLYGPMTRKTQYQPEDLQLIARVVDDPTVLVARGDGPLRSLQTVVGVSRQSPASVSAGHNGDGSNGDLALDLFQKAAHIRLTPVPYKGTGAQKTDLLGGHLQLATISASEALDLRSGGTAVQVITQFAAKRSSALPDVPTAAESGYPVQMSSERGFAGPRGMDPVIVERLEKAIAESLKDPEFIATATSDVPVLAYQPGAQWHKSMEGNRKLLQAIAEKRPRQ